MSIIDRLSQPCPKTLDQTIFNNLITFYKYHVEGKDKIDFVESGFRVVLRIIFANVDDKKIIVPTDKEDWKEKVKQRASADKKWLQERHKLKYHTWIQDGRIQLADSLLDYTSNSIQGNLVWDLMIYKEQLKKSHKDIVSAL
jgi:hypothetical protein